MLGAIGNSGSEGLLGDELDLLLDQLTRRGIRLGPRDRTNAVALLADLVARQKVTRFRDVRSWLAPLLARTPAEREQYFAVFDSLAPNAAPSQDAGPPTEASTASRSWGTWAIVAALLCTLVVAAAYFYRTTQEPVQKPPLPVTVEQAKPDPAPSTSAPRQPSAPPPQSASDLLNRIATAAEPFEGAPTLDELGPALANTASPSIGWPASSYSIKLSELSGLPRTWPLALYGKDGREGRVWAMLALALSRVEHPGREASFSELRDAANRALASQSPSTRHRVYEIASRLAGWFPGSVPEGRAALVAQIQAHYLADEAKDLGLTDDGQSGLQPPDEFSVLRALAITDDPRLRQVFPDSPWIPLQASNAAPWWAALLATLVPLAFAVYFIVNGVSIRKAYLRRRPPDLPPLHLDLVADIKRPGTQSLLLFRRVVNKLRRRTARPTDRLDLEASIVSTLQGGGEIPHPVYELLRQTPEYLVLIEQRSLGDQDAKRLRALLSGLEPLLQLTVFMFRSQPSVLDPEGGGRSVTIEQLKSQFPEHRLLVVGSGVDFLDPATLKPHASVETIMQWDHRALLTPLPVAEWGREELALANELQMPIGRATPEGLLTLAELLGLEGIERDLIDPRGDGLARPLSKVLRALPHRFLYSAPPSDLPVPRLLRELRNFLDGPAFEWLCAIAVYPAVQWDLTLYLGLSLPEKAGGDAAVAPLYREDRLAALTQLPWLREGSMPNWLRASLIAELDEERAEEIRSKLRRLIDAAKLSGDPKRDSAVKLRISRESPKERLPPHEFFQDEVLLDFLARGRIEDLALTSSSWLQRHLPRRLIDRFGIPELVAVLLALAYATTAYLVTPKDTDGELVTGAWLPLLALGVGALISLGVTNPTAAFQGLRQGLTRLAPYALAYAVATSAIFGTAGFSLLVDGMATHLRLPADIGWPIALTLFLLAMPPLVILCIAAARASGIPLPSSRSPVWHQRLALVGWSGAIAALAAMTYKLGAGEHGAQVAGFGDLSPALDMVPRPIGYAIAAALAAFACAWLMARIGPERVRPSRSMPRGAGVNWAFGSVRSALILAPIVPAVWLSAYVAASSIRLPDIPGGATAVAELADGSLFAIGGADGKVRVFRVADQAVDLAHVGLIDVGIAAIADMALEADSQGTAQLLVSTAAGRSHLYNPHSMQPVSNPLAAALSEGSKFRVAFAPDPIAAIEIENGEAQILSSSGAIRLARSNPVTSLAQVGRGYIAFATLDGEVHIARSDPGQPPTLVAQSDEVQFEGGVRQLAFDAQEGTLTVLSDDGLVQKLAIGSDGTITKVGGPVQQANLSLGPPVPRENITPPVTAPAETPPAAPEVAAPPPPPSTTPTEPPPTAAISPPDTHPSPQPDVTAIPPTPAESTPPPPLPPVEAPVDASRAPPSVGALPAETTPAPAVPPPPPPAAVSPPVTSPPAKPPERATTPRRPTTPVARPPTRRAPSPAAKGFNSRSLLTPKR